ncbi:NrfD/PsrC family molybdoenzyme membrane anchor subunit [Chloroflexota bacterium]
MRYPEKQKSWGWVVATYVFLAGTGGGTFLSSFILESMGKHELIARIGALLGPVLVLIGTFFLLADLGSVTRVYRLFSTSSAFVASWMIRGTWILTIFIIFGLAYSLPSFELFEWLPWSKVSGVGQSIGIVAALLSALVVIYPGFLFSAARGIPFWNTAALPPLFFLSSLEAGIAVLAIIALFFTANFGVDVFHQLGAADVGLMFIELIVLGAYLDTIRHASISAAASVRLLINPLFIGGAVTIGLLLPLSLLLYSVFITDAFLLYILVGVTSVFVLFGGLLLRYCITRAGVYVLIH